MRFKKIFQKLLKEEGMSAGDGGVFGDFGGEHGGSVGNNDFYATGDARNLWGWGEGGSKKSKQKSKKKKGKNAILMPVQRRPFLVSESKQQFPYLILIKKNYQWQKIKRVYAYTENQAVKKFLLNNPSYEIYEIQAQIDNEEINRIEAIKQRKEEDRQRMWFNQD